MVSEVGLEPTRRYEREIFILHYVTIAKGILVVVWTISSPYHNDLGGWCIVSTHLF